jgi:hypothetical protein
VTFIRRYLAPQAANVVGMEDVLLIGHILAAILCLGTVTVAMALFPKLAAQPGQAPAARVLHRITRVYGVLALIVPGLGFGLAFRDDLMGEPWVGISMALTLVGAALVWRVVTDQAQALVTSNPSRRLAITGGLFSLTWVVILILMVVKPG